MRELRNLLLLVSPFVIAMLLMAATRESYMETIQQEPVRLTSVCEPVEDMTPEAAEKENTCSLPSAGAVLDDLVYRKPEAVRTCTMNLDSGEMQILLKIAAAEAMTEDVRGKALVMRVVINRTQCSGFPDSIQEVVLEHSGRVYQFTPVKDGTYETAQPDAGCYEALDLVLHGWDESQGATYFCTQKSAGKWHEPNLSYLFAHGKHRFYKEKEETK